MVYTSEVLEYEKLKSLLRRYTLSTLGLRRVDDLVPSSQIDPIREDLALCSEAKLFYESADGFPLRGIRDISQFLTIAEKIGTILPLEALIELWQVCKVCDRVKRKSKHVEVEDFPRLSEIFEIVPTFPTLIEELRNCLSPEGEILDSASPKLRTIRRKLSQNRKNLHSKLEAILRSSQHQKSIQEQVITTRNSRYVIPIKSDAKSTFRGLVHGQSSSGATLYVEPIETVEINNTISQLIDEEREEIRRILIELTNLVRENIEALQLAIEILGDLEFLGAKAQLSIDLESSEPKLNSDGKIKIRSARHPILELTLRKDRSEKDQDLPRNEVRDLPSKIVPIDVGLGDKFQTLIITGPNTGGKTVVLKTIGLLTLMAQSGLHIPAAIGSEIAVFDQIFADIGDEQSIEQNLSTFSSHTTKIVNVVENADHRSLVLLDEIGAGTDPTEGAALAMAVTDHLTDRNAKTIVTTHYSALKSHAHNNPKMENASMDFDQETLKPTYRLRIGVPGGSHAFHIAQRLGMPESILENSRNYLGDRIVAVEDLIASFQESQRKLESDREELESKLRDAEITQKRYENELDRLKSHRDGLRINAEREAAEIVKNARQLVEQTVFEIRKEQASKESIKTAQAQIDRERQKYQKPNRKTKKEFPKIDLEIGDKVLVKNLNSFGEVIAISQSKKPKITVRIGNFQMQLSFDEIEKPKNIATNRKLSTSVLDLQLSKTSSVASEINLIGKRIDEAITEVDKYIDDAYLGGLPTARIVHGVGTGALRKAIQDHLKDHPSIATFEIAPRNEGGFGVTIVKFSD